MKKKIKKPKKNKLYLNKTFFLILISILLLTFISAAWYNPLTWFSPMSQPDSDPTLSIISNNNWLCNANYDDNYTCEIEDKNSQKTTISFCHKTITDKDLLPNHKDICFNKDCTDTLELNQKQENGKVCYERKTDTEYFIKLNPTVIYQDINMINYKSNNYDINVSLVCDDVVQNDIWVLIDNGKFGATGNFTGLKNCTYIIDSDVELRSYKNRIINDEYDFGMNLEDICEKRYEPYEKTITDTRHYCNGKEISPEGECIGIRTTIDEEYNITAYKKTANCKFSKEQNIFYVNFLSDNDIDPTFYSFGDGELGFIDPTPDNNTATTNDTIIVNVSISNSELDEVIYNWNQSNYTYLNDSVMAYYNFDNRSSLGENNTHVVDITGNGNNGTWFGDASPDSDSGPTTDGKYAGAFEFDGTGDGINIGDDESIRVSQDFTVSAWVYADVVGSTYRRIISRELTTSCESYCLMVWNDNELVFNVNSGSGSGGARTDFNFPTGKWIHVVGVDTGTEKKLYMDGQPVASRTTSLSPNQADIDTTIGNNPNMDRPWDGKIDEVVIINRSLSNEEVNQLYMANLYKFNSTQWYLTVNQTKDNSTALENGTYTYYTYAKDESGNSNKTETRTIIIGEGVDQPPVVYLISPEDTTSSSNSSYNFVANFTDDSGLKNATLFVWNSTGSIINQTSVDISGTENLSTINVTLPYFDTYSWNYLAYDINNQSAFNSTNYTLQYTEDVDNIFPLFSNFQEAPGDPSTYIFGQSYSFNTTVINTNGTVFIDFNDVNYTMTNLTFDEYNFSISDLAADTYNYYYLSWGNGTDENFNKTETFTYTINKANPTGSISGTSPITYPTAANILGFETNSGDDDVTYNLYREGILISNPDNSILGVGTYNYVYNTTGGQNYTSNPSIDTFSLTVNQNNGDCDVLFNETSPITFPEQFIVYTNCNSDFTLKRNGTTISNNSVQSLGGGTYNFTVERTDQSNYSNIYDEELFTINKATTVMNYFLNGVVDNITIIEGDTVNASVSSNFGEAKIYRNGTDVTSENNQDIVLSEGYYQYDFNVSETQNYTGVSTETLFLTVNEAQALIEFVDPTPENNTVLNVTLDYIEANVTGDVLGDSPEWNITTYLYDSDFNLVDSNKSSSSPHFTNFTGLEPGLYYLNATILDEFGHTNSTETREIRVINWTSYLGIDIDIPDFTFSSLTPILAESIEFNSSSALTTYGALNSFNILKNTGSPTSDVYITIEVDGIEIVDELLRTVTKGQAGVSSTLPFSFSVANGNHTMDIYFYRTGTGSVTIYNTDFSLGRFETPGDIMGRGNLTSVSTTFASSTEISIFNKTINKNVNTSTFINLKANVDSLLEQDIFCRIVNGDNSPWMGVTVPSGNDVRSMQIPFITEPDNEIQTNISINCYSSLGTTVNFEGVFIEADMSDDEYNPIGHMSATNPNTNITNTIILNPGDNEIIQDNFIMKNGTNVLISASSTSASLTGAQTPIHYVHIEYLNGTEVCYSEKERYTSGDVGNSFFNYVCEGLEAGTEYHISFHIVIDTGEQLELYDEAGTFFENTIFDTTTVNTPPVVVIIEPENGTTVKENVTIDVDVSDSQLDTYTYNITLSNSTGTFFLVQENSSDVETGINYIFDSKEFSDGNYDLNVSVCENETIEKLCGNDSVEIIIDNTAPEIEILSPTNDTNISNDQVDVNYTVSDNILLDQCWWTNDSGVTNTTLSSCENITGVTWPQGNNVVTVYANDSINNINSSTVYFFVDSIAPQFTPPLQTQTIPETIPFLYDINATDAGVGVSKFDINDTYGGLFTIDQDSGIMTNSSSLLGNVGEYYFNVSVNDTLGNTNYSMLLVNVTSVDLTPPYVQILFPENVTYNYIITELNFTASDNVGLDMCWYSLNGGATNTTTPCNQNITGITANEGSNTWTVYARDTTGNENNSVVTFFVDTVSPNVEILFPEDIDYNYIVTELNFTASDNIALHTCWYSLDLGATNITTPCNQNITGLTSFEGPNQWRLYVNDTTGNENSSVVSFYIDTTPPSFDNLPNVTSFTTSEQVFFEVFATDISRSIDAFSVNDSNFFILKTEEGETTAKGELINITNLVAGLYSLNISVNDTLGNTNYSTLLVNITQADIVSPNVEILFPENLPYNYVITELNFTASDDIALDSCWYSLDEGITNITTPCNQNVTGLTANEGQNIWTVYANDTSGNENNSQVDFSIDTTPPIFTNLINQTVDWNESFSYTINVFDAGSEIGNINITDNVNFTINGGTGLVTNNTIFEIFYYEMTVCVNDTAGNTNCKPWSVNSTEAVVHISQCDQEYETLKSSTSNIRPYGRLCNWLDFR